MGSSKKHKDKDREHKHKRRRHRSRSRSKERHSKRKERRENKHDKNEERHHDGYSQSTIKSTVEIQEAAFDGPTGASGGSSLSVQETNRLRLKLGLKPLEVPGSTNDDGTDGKPKEPEDVHAPPVNWGEQRKTERMREKLLAQKEKRVITNKLKKVKTLGESDSDDESAVAWVKKNRKISKEKLLAEKRAKMLEEMDQEFGISGLLDQEFHDKSKDYTSKDLTGLKVEHKLDKFLEGNSVILTLKDKGVLEDEDVLINVNILDEEVAEKNLKHKMKKPEYKPYDEPQFDEYGQLQTTNILDKYDEDVDGNKARQFFQLGSGGAYDATEDNQIDRIRKELREQGQTLAMSAPNLTSEYYSHDEMSAKFKKVKKKVRKIRKRAVLKADDLLPLPEEASHPESDYGSRQRGKGWIKEESENGCQDGEVLTEDGQPMDVDSYQSRPDQEDIVPLVKSEPNIEMPSIKFEDSAMDDILGPDEDLTGVVVDDEVENELHSALSKARRLKQKKKIKPPDKVVEEVISQNEPSTTDSTVNANGSTIILNSTSEFCRNLGEIPTYGLSGNRDEKREEIMDTELELLEQERREQEMEEMTSGWNEVDIDTKPVDIVGEETSVLEEEPIVADGVGAALKLAERKGYLVNESKKHTSAPSHSHLAAKHYSIEDKRYDDLDEKFRKRERYHGGGIVSEFREKEGYKPEVRLQYVDDSGRSMNAKEAFRQLSHRFHGKGSGKKKTEKRQKKIEEANLMKQMSSTDTPLNTLSLLKEKQKAEKSPFVVLSGNKGFTANTITKF
ncbi:U4/U6.U5 tri-snRNP-associated protein 1-like [Gigantopelta aegis]|uniref:U4/U6.U5 tri-snRNP-associated protein 1-like n=1 Tax=Gigantopelta aegis TaxID=1735272 RepID=UPI001B88B8DA|nr:U4/U6.U5 tri-snRNP-associated protein 1-like [Gigantopelta aegis]